MAEQQREVDERAGFAGALGASGGVGGHVGAPHEIDAYVAVVLEVAGRDASIARVLREICTLDGAVRAGALELVGAHLRTRTTAQDVFRCLDALRRDDVARRIAERLGV
ncbi:MAG: hypothetical protein HYU41_17260 [Candidatus Rokubacteria bacterium]|nr:hypothetical protein [Candidatus Rokubacteria bacterium]